MTSPLSSEYLQGLIHLPLVHLGIWAEVVQLLLLSGKI